MKSDNPVIVAITALGVSLIVSIVALVRIAVGTARNRWRISAEHDGKKGDGDE